jgi:hypothetical protein
LSSVTDTFISLFAGVLQSLNCFDGIIEKGIYFFDHSKNENHTMIHVANKKKRTNEAQGVFFSSLAF